MGVPRSARLVPSVDDRSDPTRDSALKTAREEKTCRR